MKSLILPILATTSLLSAIAILNPNSASAGPIHERQVNQQERIYKGVQQGTISQQEYKKLEAREAKIAAQRRVYLSDGDLNRKEAARLTNAQNRTSRAIYRDRHD
ncbi:hypothetical protein APA_3924 [Pseudanabaena sp. lw0831]|uniref:hypothetical protein n=1 Tax=Pseudanabaena sp. lw0831 TaxID=1357935 RepID=UPI001916B700|nr:hypothetical protein [Pseudanabaena sp. lw0831]GBO55774.1 hypothetical protein APA_3924 [Pseudanabaena sp. lw0831]